MDNDLPLDDAEIERRLLIKAVEQARRDPRPSIPDEVVQARMQKKVKKLQAKLAAIIAE